jgi:hypothetical protein
MCDLACGIEGRFLKECNSNNMKPHRGTLILVLGILGLVVCGPCGIAAWIMGANDLKEMDAGAMDPVGRGQTQAGKICGMIACILMVVGLVFFMIAMIGAMGAASHQR